MQFDRLWRNARLATLAPVLPGLGAIERGAIACRDGRIVYAGPEESLPSHASAETIDCGGRWITPGLVDCHTHLVFGGNRAREFELRLAGASYEEIARAGGGILSTVKATRAASEDELVAAALPRLDHLIAEGVTTVEVKSGYGLDVPTEERLCRLAAELTARLDVRDAVRDRFIVLEAVAIGLDEGMAVHPEDLAHQLLPEAVHHGHHDDQRRHPQQIGRAHV